MSTSRFRTITFPLAALTFLACGPGPDADAGRQEDAAVSDGGVTLDADAVDGGARDDGGTPGDGSTSRCTDGERRCGAASEVEECVDGSFVRIEECPIACADGACSDTVSCTPGARRCAGEVSQICSASGTAFLFGEACESASACVDGLCTGACTPGALRCDGLQAERCADDGSGYVAADACEVACVAGRCALERLDVTSDMELDGEIIVAGPVNVFPGATLRAPSGDLTIRAQTITIDATASIIVAPTGTSRAGLGGAGDRCYGGGITSSGGGGGGGYGTGGSHGDIRGYTCGGSGGSAWGSTTDALVHRGSPGGPSAFDTYPGGRGGGVLRLIADRITIDGSVHADGEAGQGSYTSASGSGSGGGILIAADQISIGGVVSAEGGDNPDAAGSGGDGRVKILYGASADVTGTVAGALTQALLPPLTIGSLTHPEPALEYADGFEHAVIAWDRPSPATQAYYVIVDTSPSHVPTAADAELLLGETLVVPRAALVDGDNYVHVVPVDAMSAVGTVESTFRIRIETAPPALGSASHPSQTEWSSNANVLFEWTMPGSDASYRGVRYVLDHQGDTVPSAADTFLPITQTQLLQAGLADGVWAFHVVAVDSRGRLTRDAAHYRVRIGSDPGAGTILGHVAGPSGPVAGATVSVNRGLFPTQMTNSTGDFNLGAIPAGSWELTVTADGFGVFRQSVTVTADGSVTVPVALTPL